MQEDAKLSVEGMGCGGARVFFITIRACFDEGGGVVELEASAALWRGILQKDKSTW